ncbi:hypothetical protein AA313_de0208135 [Arthrobotrys entomopaga]|nr:hypothetical protein AA313_de0208135 [Arthrobotrys entomopaga]
MYPNNKVGPAWHRMKLSRDEGLALLGKPGATTEFLKMARTAYEFPSRTKSQPQLVSFLLPTQKTREVGNAAQDLERTAAIESPSPKPSQGSGPNERTYSSG